MLLLVTSTARISSVSSSIPMWILRQTRRLGPPAARQHMLACVRGILACVPLITRQAHARHAAERAPSPSTLMPVLSTARQGIAQQCPERGSAGAVVP